MLREWEMKVIYRKWEHGASKKCQGCLKAESYSMTLLESHKEDKHHWILYQASILTHI